MNLMDTKFRCDNCLFFGPDSIDPGSGDCLLNPPVKNYVSEDEVVESQPFTSCHHVCSKYEHYNGHVVITLRQFLNDRNLKQQFDNSLTY